MKDEAQEKVRMEIKVWRKGISQQSYPLRVGQNYIYVYIRCICGIVGKKITNYTVLYGVCIRFWPTLYPLSTFPYLVKALVRTHKYMHRHQIFLIVYTHGTTFSKWTSYSSFPDCLYTQDYIRHLDELFELF